MESSKSDLIIESLIQEMMSMTDDAKRDTFICENKKIFIPVVTLLINSLKTSVASKDPRIHGQQQFALKCLSFISSASSSSCDTELTSHMVKESHFIIYCISEMMDENGHDHETCSSMLINLTRDHQAAQDIFKLCPKDFLEKLLLKFEKKELMASLLMNFTQIKEVRHWIVHESKVVDQLFESFNNSSTKPHMKCTCLSVIRNCCFDSHAHQTLLEPSRELLTKLLYPLVGNEEIDDEDMKKIPIDLQYLGPEKRRESDEELRKLLVDCFLLLCATKEGRESLRRENVYIILREAHKSEQARHVQKTLEDICEILIKREDEINADNLLNINIPQEFISKFDEMDKQLMVND